MKKTMFWALIGLNAVLLVSFLGRVGVVGDNPASAQNRGGRPGEFVMIPGEITGGGSGVVYVIDVTNGALGGMTYDEPRKVLEVMEPIDLNRVFEAGAGGAGGAGGARNRNRTGAGGTGGERD
jgi:hypothetical protein